MAIGSFQRVYGRSSNFIIGNKKVEFRQVQLTTGANYATGGELIAPSLVGLKHIEFALVTGPATSITNTDTAYVVKLHSQAGGSQRLHVFEVGPAPGGVLTEVAANTNLAGYFIQVAFIGY